MRIKVTIMLIIWANVPWRVYSQIPEGDMFSCPSCTSLLGDYISEVFVLGNTPKQVFELKNQIVYIEDIGFVSLRNGKTFDLNEAVDRENLYQQLTDSIVSLKTQDTHEIINIRTNFRYFRRLPANKGNTTIQSFNGNLIPLIRDSSFYLVDITSGNIRTSIIGKTRFRERVDINGQSLFCADDSTIYELSKTKGAVINRYRIGGLGSEVVAQNGRIIYWDQSTGLVVLDSLRKIVWQRPSQKPKIIRRLLNDGQYLFVSDRKLNALSLLNGNILWTDKSESILVHPNNFILTQNMIVTSMYHDSEGVIVMIDSLTGKVLCNGLGMPKEIGYSRYTFLNSSYDNYFFGIDVGGDLYRIVRFEVKQK